MKKAVLIVLVFISTVLWGQSFETVVDFGIELSTLNIEESATKVAQDGKIVILEGLLGDSQTDIDSPGDRVWITLMGGEWIGTDTVVAYSCRILFEGEEWLEAFPGEKPRDPSENYIPQGSRLLVAARIIGFDTEAGTPIAEMIEFRVLQ